MARPRTELHTLLESILGSKNVYFQPPSNKDLDFPCIVYERSGSKNEHADNLKYIKYKRYTITYIDQNPVSPIVDELEDLQYCTAEKSFVSENRNHFPFTIYF